VTALQLTVSSWTPHSRAALLDQSLSPLPQRLAAFHCLLAQERHELLPQFAGVEGNILSRDGAPVFAVDRAVDHEGQAQAAVVEADLRQEVVRVERRTWNPSRFSTAATAASIRERSASIASRSSEPM